MDQPSENAVVVIGPHKPNSSKSQANSADQPLPLDDQTIDADARTITLDLTAFDSRMHSDQTSRSASDSTARWYRHSPLAASVALATLLGVLAGTAATVALMPDKPAAAPVVAAQSDETRALQERVAKLSGEVAALKSNLETANRTAATQLTKIGDRLDRSEKAQAEPAAKLAKIMDTLDRLERRTVASAASADITGSVTSIEKQASKPPVVDGWRLVDFYAGRAVLENRVGTLFEVGPGSNLPGIGRIEAIKRVDGKIVVTTAKGTITSALEPQRRSYHLPPGY